MTDLVSLLKTIGAPVLATAIGGPIGTLASAALGALADALGTDPTPDAVASKVAAGGEAAATVVRQVEADKSADYLAILSKEIEDRKDARAMQIVEVQTGHWTSNMPAVLAIMLAVLFGTAMAFLFLKGIPESQLSLLLIGALISEFRGSLAFFFGTTAGSARNGDAMRTIAKQATSPTIGQVAGQAIDAIRNTKSTG